MQEYKKRVRLLAENVGASIDYAHDGCLIISTMSGRITFTSLSKTLMNCSVAGELEFDSDMVYVFDIILRLTKGRPLDGYKPKGLPLTLQEYIDEEHGEERISELRERISAGTAENKELGGNHYNAKYYNGILIVFDLFTGAPANVVEF